MGKFPETYNDPSLLGGGGEGRNKTGRIETINQPVLLKSAQSLSRFLMLLSECIGKALLMSSILILLGVSGLFQNRR